jgi:hypothetical protein
MRRAATASLIVIAVAAPIAGYALWRASDSAASTDPGAQAHVVTPAPLSGTRGGVATALADARTAAAAGASAGPHSIAATAASTASAHGTPPAPGGSAAAARAELPAGLTPGARPAAAAHADPTTPVGKNASHEGQAGQSAPAAGARHAADPSGIMSAVQTAVPAIKECYAAWRKQQPGLAGALKVAMTIGEDPADASRGKVTGARIANSELQSAAVQGCLLNALETLEFERPQDGKVEVTLPFRFDAVESARPTPE